MQFTVRISKQDYRAALRLKRKNMRRAIFAVFALDAGLWIFWMVSVLRGELVRANSVFSQALIFLAYPLFCVMFLAWSTSHTYRRNRNIQGQFVYEVTEENLSYKSESGASAMSPWSSLNFWRESKRVFILVYPSGVFQIIPKSRIGEGQVDELRSILAKHLRKN
jgi:hypothetical protein